MAEPRIATSPLATLVAVNGQGVAAALGLVMNFRCEKTFEIEPIREWGSYKNIYVLMGYSGTFSWGRTKSYGADLVSLGLIPSSTEIPQFLPSIIRVIDFQSQRNIVQLVQVFVQTCSFGGDARARIDEGVSGICQDINFESEVN